MSEVLIARGLFHTHSQSEPAAQGAIVVGWDLREGKSLEQTSSSTPERTRLLCLLPHCVPLCASLAEGRESEKWKQLPRRQYARSPSSGLVCENRNPHPAVNQQPVNEHICPIQLRYLLSSHHVQSSDRSYRSVNIKERALTSESS